MAAVPNAPGARSSPAQDIRALCAGDAACVERQQIALRHFLGNMVMWTVPEKEAERCMRAGRRGRFIDWPEAKACIRDWRDGRPSIVEQELPRR